MILKYLELKDISRLSRSCIYFRDILLSRLIRINRKIFNDILINLSPLLRKSDEITIIIKNIEDLLKDKDINKLYHDNLCIVDSLVSQLMLYNNGMELIGSHIDSKDIHNIVLSDDKLSINIYYGKNIRSLNFFRLSIRCIKRKHTITGEDIKQNIKKHYNYDDLRLKIITKIFKISKHDKFAILISDHEYYNVVYRVYSIKELYRFMRNLYRDWAEFTI